MDEFERKRKKNTQRFERNDSARRRGDDTMRNRRRFPPPRRIEFGKALIYNSWRKLVACLLAFHSTRRRVAKIFCFERLFKRDEIRAIFIRDGTHCRSPRHSAIVFTTFARSLSAPSRTFARLCASQVLFPPGSTPRVLAQHPSFLRIEEWNSFVVRGEMKKREIRLRDDEHRDSRLWRSKG